MHHNDGTRKIASMPAVTRTYKNGRAGNVGPPILARRRPLARRRGSRRLVTASFLGLLAMPVVVLTSSSVEAAEEGLRETGSVMRNVTEAQVAPNDVPPMIVDQTNSLGFAAGRPKRSADGSVHKVFGDAGDVNFANNHLVVYDLRTLQPIAVHEISGGVNSGTEKVVFTSAIDEENRRLFVTLGPRGISDATFAPCSAPIVGRPADLFILDYSDVAQRKTGATIKVEERDLDCTGDQRFEPHAVSYDAGSEKLYVYGTYARENWRLLPGGAAADNLGQSLLLRQIDGNSLTLDWQVDLQTAGCGQMVGGVIPTGPFVTRIGNRVVSYCFDPKPIFSFATGRQGYVVTIPLSGNHRPIPQSGEGFVTTSDGTLLNAVIRRTPALSGSVTPVPEPGSGRLLLVTTGSANGNAVWVFSPDAERFIGTVAGGVSDEPPGNTAVGVDQVRGRAYVLTADGVLVAPIRQDPLPPGVLFEVTENAERVSGFARGPIGVAPAMKRLFVPVTQKGYVVVEDRFPDPLPPLPGDPDALSLDVDEEEGTTTVRRSGGAIGSGAHMVVTGGIPRAMHHNDPFCIHYFPGLPDFAFEPQAFEGECFWEQVFSEGHREMYMAWADLHAATDTESVADAAGVFFPPSDTATDADFKRSGLNENGTKGDDGRGFPVSMSHCGDFDGNPTSDRQVPSPQGLPRSAVSSSEVSCDVEKVAATATSKAGVLTITQTSEPVLSVSRVSTSLKTSLRNQGQVTEVLSRAIGVQVGPLAISEVRSRSVTWAKGRNGSTHADLQRWWCGVTVDGRSESEGCLNAEGPQVRQLVDQLNQRLGRIQLSVPQGREAPTERFQATVTKHPGVRGADSAVNDDDSHTVSGLQVVLYNDGVEGRSRVIVQLAGVHGESRYGIQSVPHFTVPIFALPEIELPPASVPGLSDVEPAVAAGLAAVPDGNDFITIPAAEIEPVEKNPLRQFLEMIQGAIEDGLRLLVNHPLQFFRLLFLWSLLASGPYFMMRRRRLAGQLIPEVN